MKAIPLTKGAVALVDDEDFDHLSRHSWHLTAQGYAGRTSQVGKVKSWLLMHRVVAKAPAGMHVDHANGNKLDNRQSNLRCCTPAQNQANRSVQSGRRYKGVIYQKQIAPKVRAEINVNGQARHLGCFASAEDAARAYDRAAREQWGEFARLNFPDECAA